MIGATVTAWAVTAGVAAVAAAVCAQLGLSARRSAACETERVAAEGRAALLEAALARGATGALRLSTSGDPIAVGTVPASLTDGARGRGELAAPIAALLRGSPFQRALPGPLRVVGTVDGGHATVFVGPPEAATGGTLVAERLIALLARAPHPAWVEADGGDRVWTNAAYARAMGAGSADAATGAGEPLLDANAAAQIARGGPTERVATVVRGVRRLLDVTADRRDGTLAALAVDVTETQQALSEKSRALESHAATFDRLATAVAIYGPDRRLTFHNAAFQTLWGLPSSFLETNPPEDRVLDRLRAERRLPETADFRAWKRDQLKGGETREGSERWWHLPDGQTLRVIANPGPDGGVTYIYENVTEQLALERRYNALSRVQAETIDNLGEGIASFGPDGLLRLANPAFWTLTGVAAAEVGDHVRDIAAGATEAADAWAALALHVTGLTDHRTALTGRVECGARVLDYAFSPLPDGSTLATFADVTDTVNIARALMERNEALVEADRLKNAFVQHVSYELRSPLNVIIGFAQMLTRAETGALSPKQREYADYIRASSEALQVIIDGILDLTSIDAGVMELSLGAVDVAASVREALDGLKDRVAEAELDVRLDIAAEAASFEGDRKRVVQILFNLLSNAVSHSPPGGTVVVASRPDGAFVAISVRDHGPGIPREKAAAIFERFMTAGSGGRRGGVGLGLSLVKSFVELHGGTVAVAPVAGPGAELVVRFPRALAAETGTAAAETKHAA
jgi:signal transduction histidine kinase